MTNVEELLHRLRTRMQLPTPTFDVLETVLRSGKESPRTALLDVGMSEAQVDALLEGVSHTGTKRRPARPQTVETVSEEPSVDDLISRLIDITDRFEIQGEIARGAMGRILAAWDLHLGRPVAIKILRKSSARDLDRVRFLEEAQVTGQLQHPSVMPVYELGRINDQVAFVMRRIEGRSLKGVIAGLRRGDETMTKEFGQSRLVNVFHQLCMAVSYAHTRAVVHRDLKPSNVMVGDFGEVVLLDWGLCKVIGGATRSTRSTSDRWKTVHGQIIGTPAYMAPEQAAGLIDQVDQRTDVYGLGAILYHLLTLRPPFTGKTNREIVNRVLQEEVVPPSERAPNRRIHEKLEQICCRCLSRDPESRYSNAGELAKAIRKFLDSPTVTDSVTIPRGSPEFLSKGLSAITRHQGLLEDAALISDELITARAIIDPGDPPSAKKNAWRAEVELKTIQGSIGAAYAEAVHALERAVSLDARAHEARSTLCDLFIARFEESRLRNDAAGIAYYRTVLAAHDAGSYQSLINGEGSLQVGIDPRPAEIRLVRQEERDRRLQAIEETALGTSPVKVDPIKEGTYSLQLSAPGFEPLEAPVIINPGRCTHLRLRMLRQGMVPRGFTHIPSGTFLFGNPSDPYSTSTEQALPDFLIATYPVTVGEYLEFVNHVAKTDVEEASRYVPRLPDGVRPAWHPNERQRFSLPAMSDWTMKTPIVGVNANQARSYCRWRSLSEQRPLRLPSEMEWEKAARGVDGRCYPWGWSWDPAFAATSATWSSASPPPIGNYPEDASPYGIRDLAGGVREWTSTAAAGRGSRVVVRGGSYRSGYESGRPMWEKESIGADYCAHDLGFRLALDINLIPTFDGVEGGE